VALDEAYESSIPPGLKQFVKAADEGRKLHFIDKPTTEGYAGPDVPAWMRNLRKTEGFPEEGFAKTPYGKDVEMITDQVPGPVALDEAYEGSIPSGLRQFVQTDPNMRIYELNFHGLDALKLVDLRDKMAKMRQMSPEFSKYGQPAVKIPEQYMFTDKSLQGLTPAQASERVAQFDAWKQEAQQKMASRAAFVDPAISRTRAADGYVWVNPPDLERNPAMRELIQDVGCDGGWCTKSEATALNYGSGDNRLSVLMDSKARPRAQITITTKQYTPDDFISSMADDEVVAFRAKYPDIAAYQTDEIALTPEFRQWQSMNPDSLSITEIKGVNNQADLTNSPYLKQIQQRVKNIDSQFGLQQVENLDGIGMTDLTSKLWGHPAIADRSGINRETMQTINQEMSRLNSGSRFIENDKATIDSLIKQAADNILGPEKRATGGMVERRSDDRKYL
jgi:hypothetical protein